jgi:uncharacterized protein YbjT (DUF2867 family)
MKLTVIGASGLIGIEVVDLLTAQGHHVVATSRSTGVDVLTGEGLADALADADVLVDVVNSPSFEDDAVLQFFSTSTTNLVAAAKTAGVAHYVALSIVGADDLPDSGYMRAKVVQQKTLVESGIPYSVVRATQFEEFTGFIIVSMLQPDNDNANTVRVPDALIQPIASEEVAAEVVRVALGAPLNGFEDIGGPEKIPFADLARRVRGSCATIVVDPNAEYFGTRLQGNSLVTPSRSLRDR